MNWERYFKIEAILYGDPRWSMHDEYRVFNLATDKVVGIFMYRQQAEKWINVWTEQIDSAMEGFLLNE